MLEDAESRCRPGQSLRAARERAGLSRQEVAERLNLTAEQIAALEADDYAALVGPTFVQGHLRAYGRLLGVAGDELVARYRTAMQDQSGARQPARQRPTLDCGHSQRYWGLALLALVLAGLWGWQQRAGEWSEMAEEPAPPMAEAASQSAVDAVLSPVSALGGEIRWPGREESTMEDLERPSPLRPAWHAGAETVRPAVQPPRSLQGAADHHRERAGESARDEQS